MGQKVESRNLKSNGEELQITYIKEPSNGPAKTHRIYHYHDAGVVRTHQGGFSGQLLHGSFARYSKTGQLLEQGTFRRGLKSGEWTLWDNDGNLTATEQYRSGVLHGQMEEYQEGQLVRSAAYKKGKLHGKLLIFLNGEVQSETRYKGGEEQIEEPAEEIKQIILKEKIDEK